MRSRNTGISRAVIQDDRIAIWLDCQTAREDHLFTSSNAQDPRPKIQVTLLEMTSALKIESADLDGEHPHMSAHAMVKPASP
jgi:hypothetical protein